jgi:hypothetical protein
VQTSQKGQTSALVNDASERNSNRSQVPRVYYLVVSTVLTTRAGHAITNRLRQEIVSTPICRHIALIAIAHRSSAHYLHNDPVTELLEQLEFLRNRIFVDDYDDDDEDDDSLPMTHAFGLSSTSRSVNGLFAPRGCIYYVRPASIRSNNRATARRPTIDVQPAARGLFISV